MGPDPDVGEHIRPQYAGEDTRLTSRKELAGWYAYGFAAEVFIICGMGQFNLDVLTAECNMLTMATDRILYSYYIGTTSTREWSLII
jgi:hypothetical protein